LDTPEHADSAFLKKKSPKNRQKKIQKNFREFLIFIFFWLLVFRVQFRVCLQKIGGCFSSLTQASTNLKWIDLGRLAPASDVAGGHTIPF
jgi:hypothetical protein